MPNYYGPWGNPNDTYRVWTAVSQSQSTAGNTSTVTAAGYFQDRYGYGIWDNNVLIQISIRGSMRRNTSVALAGGANASVSLGSGSHTISHNADGTLSNSAISVHANTRNTGLYSGTASGSLSHPTIPRATTPNSGNFTTGVATTINLPRASSSFTHEVTYKFGSKTGTIATAAGVTASWTPPHSLLDQIPNSVSGNVEITVVTKSGSTTVGTKKMTKTLTAHSSIVPDVTAVALTDQNTTVVNNIGAYVQGLSLVKGVVSATGIYGSTIPSTPSARRISVDGVTRNQGEEIALTTDGTVPVIGYATDTRSRVGAFHGTITVLPYSDPEITLMDVYRSATAAGAQTDDGQYLRVRLTTAVVSLIVGGAQKNSHTIQIRTRPTGGAWTTRNTVNASLAYDSTINVSGGGIYSDLLSYEVEVTVTDKAGRSIRVTQGVATARPALDLNGFNVGLSKMHERGALDVGGDGYFTGNLMIRNSQQVATWESQHRTFALKSQLDAWSAPDGTVAYVSADNRHYVRTGGMWMPLGHAPFAVAAGGVMVTPSVADTQVNQLVNFPTNRFTVAPIVTLTANANIPQYGVNLTAIDVTKSSMRIALRRSNVVATFVFWHAIQMLEDAAAG